MNANRVGYMVPEEAANLRQVYAKGRVCAHDGCGKTLSSYNPGAYCYEHEPEPSYPQMMDNLFGKRPSERTRIERARNRKWCSDCQAYLPLTKEFWYTFRVAKRPNGDVQWSAYCKTHHKARVATAKQKRLAKRKASA